MEVAIPKAFSTLRLEVIDEAVAEEERVLSEPTSQPSPALLGRSARAHLWAAVSSLNAVTVAEVRSAILDLRRGPC